MIMSPQSPTGSIIKQDESEPVLYHGLQPREGEAILTQQGVEAAGNINIVMKMNFGSVLTKSRSRSIRLQKRGPDGN